MVENIPTTPEAFAKVATEKLLGDNPEKFISDLHGDTNARRTLIEVGAWALMPEKPRKVLTSRIWRRRR